MNLLWLQFDYRTGQLEREQSPSLLLVFIITKTGVQVITKRVNFGRKSKRKETTDLRMNCLVK